MNTKHTPAPKIISVEETEDFIIKWYNEHLSFKQISDIINERAEKIVAINSELLKACISMEKNYREMAHAIGEEGLLPEDTSYQLIVSAIKKATE